MTTLTPTHRGWNRDYRAWAGIAAATFVVLAFAMALAPAAPTRSSSGASALVVHPAVDAVYINVSATELSTFVSDQVSAPVGAPVHLKVTQMADFDHTFLLSPVANFSFPSTDTDTDIVAFFALHTPLVNFTLGSTPGAAFFANFTAPAAGVYEFVCEIPGHFAGGMHGTLTTTSPGSNPPPATPSSISTTLIIVVVVLVIIAAVAMMAMRRRKSPPATETPPPTA